MRPAKIHLRSPRVPLRRGLVRGAGVLLLAVVALSGCSARGELTLRLLGVEFDQPYAAVQTLRVQVLDQQLAPQQTFDVSPEAPVDLGLVDEQPRAQLVVSGLDAAGQVRAQGRSRLLDLSSGMSAEEIVPFSTPRTVVALPLSLAARSPIEVDGSLQEWVASPSAVLDERYRVSGPKKGALVLRGELLLAWSPTGLWFALRVFDRCPTLVVGQTAAGCAPSAAVDRISFGFDGNADGGSYRSGDLFVDAQAREAVVRAGDDVDPQALSLAFGLADNGWVVEGKVSPQALGYAGFGPAERVGLEMTLIDETGEQPEPTVLRLSRSAVPLGQVTPIGELAVLGFGQP